MSTRDIPASGAAPGPEGSPLPGRKLDSWGEIASYLGREVRTVQRWENTEALPIRRHEHKKKSTVYAYTGELDAWIQRRQPKDDPEADDAFAREQALTATDSPIDVVEPPVAPPVPDLTPVPIPEPIKSEPPKGKRTLSVALFAVAILCAISFWSATRPSFGLTLSLATFPRSAKRSPTSPRRRLAGLSHPFPCRPARNRTSLRGPGPSTPLHRRSRKPAMPTIKPNLPSATA